MCMIICVMLYDVDVIECFAFSNFERIIDEMHGQIIAFCALSTLEAITGHAGSIPYANQCGSIKIRF